MFWTQLFYKLGQSQGHSNQKMIPNTQSDRNIVCDTQSSKDASTHQIWDSYLQ